jgi:hypothetical protein
MKSLPVIGTKDRAQLEAMRRTGGSRHRISTVKAAGALTRMMVRATPSFKDLS